MLLERTRRLGYLQQSSPGHTARQQNHSLDSDAMKSESMLCHNLPLPLWPSSSKGLGCLYSGCHLLCLCPAPPPPQLLTDGSYSLVFLVFGNRPGKTVSAKSQVLGAALSKQVQEEHSGEERVGRHIWAEHSGLQPQALSKDRHTDLYRKSGMGLPVHTLMKPHQLPHTAQNINTFICRIEGLDQWFSICGS